MDYESVEETKGDDSFDVQYIEVTWEGDAQMVPLQVIPDNGYPLADGLQFTTAVDAATRNVLSVRLDLGRSTIEHNLGRGK